VQYATDNIDIEKYLNDYYLDMEIATDPNFADKDVVIKKITDPATQHSLMSYLNSSTYPKLMVREVSKDLLIHNVAYKIYYLVLRPGVGQSPTNVDGVLTAYQGEYLQRVAATTTTVETISSTLFEEAKNPQLMKNLYSSAVQGLSEIFPQFKTGNYSSNADGTVTYKDFGAGVMFIPSGLGYFSSGSGSIPAYAPLVFSFKLYEIQRLDHEVSDGKATPDGVLSYLENKSGDGYMYNYLNTVNYLSATSINPNDTDGDGIPDFLDTDDDGDGYTTKLEIKNPTTGSAYPFADIPTCTSGKKNYLDITCHP
jgi:hypothetical protein